MNSIINFLSSHQLAVIAISFIVLLVIYFIFKQLIKMALFFVLIALAIGGYYYFKDPKTAPGNIRETIHGVRTKTGKAVETGENVYKKSKDVYQKSREVAKEAKEFFGKSGEGEKQEKNPSN